MKKKMLFISLSVGFVLAAIVIVALSLGESSGKEENPNTYSKSQIIKEFEAALEKEYENINILCTDICLQESDTLQSVRFQVDSITKGRTLREKLELYRDVILPKLYNVESVTEDNIVDMEHRIEELESKEVGRVYQNHYSDMWENDSEFDMSVIVGYYDKEKYQLMESMPEGLCISIGQGVLGSYDDTPSFFCTGDWEVVKTYNCFTDDLSDSYLILDGEKTVAQAKEEIEAYYDSLYPLLGEKNGIKNKVTSITVKKIPNTEYYMFSANRTLAYDGIPAREENGTMFKDEWGVMAEAMLCESNKVDISLGMVNFFLQPTAEKTYQEIVPFSEIMDRVSYFFTGQTKFDITYVGLEYRMFKEIVEEDVYYTWIPYWTFTAENPNDDKVYKLYVDMETGKIMSFECE